MLWDVCLDDVVIDHRHHHLDQADKTLWSCIFRLLFLIPVGTIHDDTDENDAVEEQAHGILGEREVERTLPFACCWIQFDNLAFIRLAFFCQLEALIGSVMVFCLFDMLEAEEEPLATHLRIDKDWQWNSHGILTFTAEMPLIRVADMVKDKGSHVNL